MGGSPAIGLRPGVRITGGVGVVLSAFGTGGYGAGECGVPRSPAATAAICTEQKSRSR